MFYKGIVVVVVRSILYIQTRPPRIILFLLTTALNAAHIPRFRALNTHHTHLIKSIAFLVFLTTAFFFPNKSQG
jgi:hypothetical protein